MYRPSRLLAVCFFVLCIVFSAPVWASGSSVVYVSTGGVIESVPTGGGTPTTLVSNPAAIYEGLVVGPDNTAADNPNGTNPPGKYLLYACDPTHNTIIRFDPNNPPVVAGNPAAETVYAGNGKLQQPQCGRFDSTGDLVVTSKVAGSGFWIIAGAANIAFHAGGFPLPVQNAFDNSKFSKTQVTEGIAQGSTGALFIVDTANGEVIRDPYTSTAGNAPPFNESPTCLIGPAQSGCTNTTAAIPGPFGVAKKSTGEIFVSTQSKKGNNIVEFSAQGANATTCVTFSSKQSPFFMQMSADDTLYVATTSNNTGAVYSVNTGTCTATAVNSSLPPLVGIALPPTTASITAANFAGTETFNFGFAAYQLTSPGPCTVTVTASATNLALVQDAINNSSTNGVPDFPNGGSPGVDLGRDGFETAFQVEGADNPVTCPPQFSDGTFIPLEAAQVDNLLVDNPRAIRCDNPPDPTTSGCGVGEVWADYPLGGVLPGDGTYGGKVPGGSTHYLANANLDINGEPGTFCGFESPLSNTQPPGIAGTFSSGQNLSLKFRLASGANPAGCQNGPFITDAITLISVAQIFDENGNPVFVPNVAINASGNSTPPPQPLFKNDLKDKTQNEFSLSLQGYKKGIYSLTITFLSNNTSYQVVEIQVK